jgi:hypothetical protein
VDGDGNATYTGSAYEDVNAVAYVGIFGYVGADGTGDESTYFKISANGPNRAVPTVEFTSTAIDTVSETFTIDAIAATGSVGPLQLRYRSRLTGSAYGSWSSWLSDPQTGVDFARSKKLRSRDVGH